MRVADSSVFGSGRPDLKLADIHPEFDELKVGKKVKGNHGGGSPQVRDEGEASSRRPGGGGGEGGGY